jgi:hypothetical protein
LCGGVTGGNRSIPVGGDTCVDEELGSGTRLMQQERQSAGELPSEQMFLQMILGGVTGDA